MDTIKAIMDSTAANVALGVGGIGISMLEFIPWIIRVLISIAILINICVKTYKEFKK